MWCVCSGTFSRCPAAHLEEPLVRPLSCGHIALGLSQSWCAGSAWHSPHCSQWSCGSEHFLGALAPRHAPPPASQAKTPFDLSDSFLLGLRRSVITSVSLVPLPLMTDTSPLLLNLFLGDFYPGLKTRGRCFSYHCNKELEVGLFTSLAPLGLLL